MSSCVLRLMEWSETGQRTLVKKRANVVAATLRDGPRHAAFIAGSYSALHFLCFSLFFFRLGLLRVELPPRGSRASGGWGAVGGGRRHGLGCSPALVWPAGSGCLPWGPQGSRGWGAVGGRPPPRPAPLGRAAPRGSRASGGWGAVGGRTPPWPRPLGRDLGARPCWWRWSGLSWRWWWWSGGSPGGRQRRGQPGGHHERAFLDLHRGPGGRRRH